jgi:hypothetical protein
MICTGLYAFAPMPAWQQFQQPPFPHPVGAEAHLQVIFPHMDVFHFSEMMMMPSLFRYAFPPPSAVDRIIGELDSQIQEKREHAQTLRDSDAPNSAIKGVEKEIDNLTGQLLTVVDHSNAIT